MLQAICPTCRGRGLLPFQPQPVQSKPPDPAYEARCSEWVARFKKPCDA